VDQRQAELILERVPATAIVVDVGGGAAPFPRADWVLDAIPYQERSLLRGVEIGLAPRYSKDRWVQLDLCDHRPWPIPDKKFDFAVCSHLLEDVRDPVWVCSEMSRIAKAGYIEVPSRIVEQSLGVEHPSYAGYYHHRWLVSVADDGTLEFRHKPHLLHATRQAIVARLGVRRRINPRHAIATLWWTDHVPCREVLEFEEDAVIDELCQFARRMKEIPDLTVSNGLSPWAAAKRALYRARLRLGGRL
jgi:hypothetical protein